MIRVVPTTSSEADVMKLLHPAVQGWMSRFGSLTPPQLGAIPLITSGNNVLVASPTGSGKSLAGSIGIISELAKLAEAGRLEGTVYCVYVSPLRSLSNDMIKNILEPLEAINRSLAESGVSTQITAAIRTGDTKQSDRARMLRHPPHILITTPETLTTLLIAPKFSALLKTVRWLIVDEVHDLASSKRGAYMSLTMERLERVARSGLQRIGLSATLEPLDVMAKFLVGFRDDGEPKDCLIVDARFVKRMELSVFSPTNNFLTTEEKEISGVMYDKLSELIRANRTLLAFANTREGAERIAYHLSTLGIVDADTLATHHSSLSREVRLAVEDRLKSGGIRAITTSSSLELGIDIGTIDQVVQVGSARSIARTLQRVGRSGHSLKDVSRGLLIGLDRDQLVEDAVIISEAYRGHLDKVYTPRNCLDVLAQQIIGMSLEKTWTLDEAYTLIKRSYTYNELNRVEYDNVIKYLAGGYSDLEEHHVYSKIWLEEGTFSGRSGVRAFYAANAGVIPESASVRCVDENNKFVGSIDEDFLEWLSRGDIFVLSGKKYLFKYARGMYAAVASVKQGVPTVPRWHSEMLPLSFELGEAIGAMRRTLFRMIREKPKQEVLEYISKECHADPNSAEAIFTYMEAEMLFLRNAQVNVAPDNRNILVETYFDDEDRETIVFNCVFGRRVHEVLARAYAVAASRLIEESVKIQVGDSCFTLILPAGRTVVTEQLLANVGVENVEELLYSALERSAIVKRRFRQCATRGFMILKYYHGKRMAAWRQQINAESLFRHSEQIVGFPIVVEAYREVMQDMMDIASARRVLSDIKAKARRFVVVDDVPVPSPFTHNIIVAGYNDIVQIEDRRKILLDLYERVNKTIYKGRA